MTPKHVRLADGITLSERTGKVGEVVEEAGAELWVRWPGHPVSRIRRDYLVSV